MHFNIANESATSSKTRSTHGLGEYLKAPTEMCEAAFVAITAVDGVPMNTESQMSEALVGFQFRINEIQYASRRVY